MVFISNKMLHLKLSHRLQRKSEGEHESSRRLKTQFLIEMEGFDSGSEQILLIGKFLELNIRFYCNICPKF